MTLAEQISTPAFKKQFNLDLFTRVAHEYDLATRMMSLGGDARWKQMLVEALPDHTAPHCVDVACGTGDVTLELARRYPDGNIIGLDLTPAMIDVAKARATGSHNVQFRVTDMCKTGLPDSSVDMVTGSYALRNAPTLTDALAEIHRILKPGGTAAFLDFSKSPNKFLQAIQLPVLKTWGAFWGIVVHGRPEHAYIAESLRLFPDIHEFQRQLEASGFQIQRSRLFYLGTLQLTVLRRRN